MTKALMQGQIGYWVNGELVYMPKRRSSNIDCEEALRKRDRERKEELAVERRQKESAKLKLRRQRYLAKFKLGQDEPCFNVEKLKNASKTGHIAQVLTCLRPTQKQRRSVQGTGTIFFQTLTSHIFTPDTEERTALYYASLTGHHHIVELYMSLYLISVIRITESSVAATRTFREWFTSMFGTSKMGLRKKFKLEDYDLCVLNALNDDVRRKLTRQKFTLSDAMSIVEKALCHVPHTQLIVKESISARLEVINMDLDRMRKFLGSRNSRKGKKPMLNNNMLDYGSEEEYSDLLVDDENTYAGSIAEYNINVDNVITDSDHVAVRDILIKNEESINTNPIASSDIINEHSFTEIENIAEDIDSISEFTFLNDATSIDFSQVSLLELQADDEEEINRGWDVVSDLLSVESADTFMPKTSRKIPISSPYRDMLLKERTPISLFNGAGNNVVEPKVVPPREHRYIKSDDGVMKIIVEETVDEDEMQDAHWDWNGNKNSRGGKLGGLYKRHR